jgi:hypothetical protein
MINFRKNASLILGVSIPILMIILIISSIYLPGLFVKPKFNFLYISGESGTYYHNQPLYIVENEKLLKNKIITPEKQNNYYENYYYDPPKYNGKFYIYDVTKNEAREISFAMAQNLKIDSNKKSPDGFEVVYGSRSDGFFPFMYGPGNDYKTRYLKGQGLSKKLNLLLEGEYSSYYNFIGWIK